MSASRYERLMNLTFVLLNAKRPMQREEIRNVVPGYPESQTAFERMFERDKEELRRAGVNIATKPVDEFFEDSLGYLITGAPVDLKVSLSLDERAILGLAETVWRDPRLRSLARSGALAAESNRSTTLGEEVAPFTGANIGSIATLTSKVLPIVSALHTSNRVTFEYQGARDEGPQLRRVEPWGLFRVDGVWYLLGFDTEAGNPRTFRMSRISSTPVVEPHACTRSVPDGGVLSQLTQMPDEYPNSAQIEVDGNAPKDVQSYWRRHLSQTRASELGFVGVAGYLDTADYARYLLRYSPYLRVVGPPELAEALRQAASNVLERIA